MKIILIKDIKGLGKGGSVLDVKNGYARNYLLPQKLAIVANKYNLSKVESISNEAEVERIALENKFNEAASKANGTEITFVRKADENNHLFGSVSEQDISEALVEKGIEVHKSLIQMDDHIKELGNYDVKIRFTNEITADIKINVEKE